MEAISSSSAASVSGASPLLRVDRKRCTESPSSIETGGWATPGIKKADGKITSPSKTPRVRAKAKITCAELFRHSYATLVGGDIEKIKESFITSGPTGFENDSLTQQSDISFLEETAVVVFFLILLLGPMLALAAVIVPLAFGRWSQFFVACGIWCVLAFHPMPTGPESGLAKSSAARWFTLALCRYFSMRFIWPDDAREKFEECPPCICSCPPHGVFPIAGLLAIPTINYLARPNKFVGSAASIVFYTPFLRYTTVFGTIEVSRQTVVQSVESGLAVGIIPDGIAGIYNTNQADEHVGCKFRKGVARLALTQGIPVVPSYAVGNTDVMQAWFDPFGIMQKISQKLRVSIFVPVGRWGLPVPCRANITMLFSNPIMAEKRIEPTEADIGEFHQQILREVTSLYDAHKDALGHGSRRLVFI